MEDEEAVKKNIRQRKNLELKNNPRRKRTRILDPKEFKHTIEKVMKVETRMKKNFINNDGSRN